jgi:hypothetical protein
VLMNSFVVVKDYHRSFLASLLGTRKLSSDVEKWQQWQQLCGEGGDRGTKCVVAAPMGRIKTSVQVLPTVWYVRATFSTWASIHLVLI